MWLSYHDALPVLQRAALERERQKSDYPSSHQWADGSTHLLGLIGEWRYGKLIGQEPNLELLAAGDPGWDFDGVDVKASTYLSDPDLKVSPADFAKRARAFALVVVDVQKELAAYGGWAWARQMWDAPKKDYGNGLMHRLNWKELNHDGVP